MMFVPAPTLLITDDDRDFRETLRSLFEPRGFNTLTAGDGEEALEIVETGSVHVMLLDVHMPRLDGLQTIRRLRQADRSLPCILLSAGLDDEIVDQARDADAFQVLAKPIGLRKLTSVVRAALKTVYDWPHGDHRPDRPER